MKKGDRFVAQSLRRPCERLFIEVQRVAKDETWADVAVCTWAVMWKKRMPLKDGKLPDVDGLDEFQWDISDLKIQEADHMKMLREEGILK